MFCNEFAYGCRRILNICTFCISKSDMFSLILCALGVDHFVSASFLVLEIAQVFLVGCSLYL